MITPHRVCVCVCDAIIHARAYVYGVFADQLETITPAFPYRTRNTRVVG